MNDIKKESTLKDIVNRESANNELVIKDEVAALRERIDSDKREIERLKNLNKRKKKIIITLSVVIVLFAAVCVAMLLNFLTYNTPQQTTQVETSAETIAEISENEDKTLTMAEKGDDEAMYLMGERYMSGLDGYKANRQTAIEWFTKSAQKDNVKAMMMLASIYENGDGVEKSNQNAFRYYFMASRLGDKQALYKIGKFYYYGTGVDKNTDKALMYLEKSAQQNYEPAITLINLIKQEQQPTVQPAQETTHQQKAAQDSSANKQ